MAPMLLDPPPIGTVPTKNISICSDPSVVVSNYATRRTKELWWLHGHPHSKKYSDPKLVSLAALVRHDGVVYKGQKAFLYPLSADSTTPYGTMTWDQFDKMTETLAFAYSVQLQHELDEANTARKQPTIAFLGGGKTLEYFCTQLALQKLGVRVLLLAESNSTCALHHLLASCCALAIITDFQNAKIDSNGVRKLKMIEDFPKVLESASAEVDAVKFQDWGDVWERHTFIVHSSGSTGMPKPIIHTNRSMMLIARMYRLFQSFDVENWFLLFPLYHIAGISIALSNLPNGQILSFPPLSWPPSSSAIFAAWKTLSTVGHPVHCVHCAPTLIENMYEYIMDTGGDFGPLVDLKVLQPGGAALSSNIVKNLTSNGVNVKTTYGSTEIGPPFRSIPHTLDNPKCYTFRNLYPDSPFLKMEEVGEGLFECVVYKGFELAAELWEGKDENVPYRTGDLFIQDPPRSGFFVLQGRRDDLVVHTNGENTNAGALQLDIQSCTKVINKALVLGHSRPCVCLLIEVHEDYDPDSTLTRTKVWEAVQQVNERYPLHSQILQCMIYILPEGNKLPVTPKGNVKRKEAENIYASDIEALYLDDIFPSSISESQEPLSEYIRNLVSTLVDVPAESIKDWTTLYSLGITSHLALSLRSSLSSYLGRPVSLGTLFENPSISKLVSILTPPSTPTSSLHSPLDSKPASTETVHRIISSLSADFNTWPRRDSSKIYPSTQKETILLTGASGSLGTHLLSQLSTSSKISKIYAMVRGPNCIEKVQTSLESRGFDGSILNSGKIEVLNFSMQDPLLGLDIDTYHTIATTVTTVMHNAWKMDFNQSIEEFEGDCLRSTMSLLRLTHSGRPKTFVFTSSVSTCMGIGQIPPSVPEAPIGDDPSVSLSTGYALSKYIVERITQHANKILGIDIKLLRVGQLSGSTLTGHWNTSEMWPIMFATSAHPAINALPLFPGKTVDWVPVNIAASAISDILLHEQQDQEPGYAVHNVVNPHPIAWDELVGMLQSSTLTSASAPRRLEEVDMKEWAQRLFALANTGADAKDVPGLKLLQFFENMCNEEEGHVVSKLFETGKTRGVSRALRECVGMRKEWIEMIVGRWRESGFIS